MRKELLVFIFTLCSVLVSAQQNQKRLLNLQHQKSKKAHQQLKVK